MAATAVVPSNAVAAGPIAGGCRRFQSLAHMTPSPHPRRTTPIFAARRPPPSSGSAVVVVPDPRAWVGDLSGPGSEASADGYNNSDDEGAEEEEEEDDRSLDLFVRFAHSIFKKASRRARRTARSLLPSSIPTKLVRFSVDGVLVLASLWVVKGLLEVMCTFGSMVFLSILLIRGIWSGVSYIRDNQYQYIHRFEEGNRRWNGVQPAA